MASEDIVIVGAGIVGICAATALAEAGRSVLVLDRTGVCEETSSGNAAALAFPDILPLAQKGMIRQLPRWLADPLGPLSVPPAYLPRLLPWLWRFWRAGSRSAFESSVNAQVALMRLAETEWAGLMARSGTTEMLRQDGALELYESEAAFGAALSGAAVRERFGIPMEHVSGARLADLQPGLADRFVKATFLPGWKNVSDPKLLGKALWTHAERSGARFRKAEATALAPDGDGVRMRLADGQEIVAGRAVIAAGAWSHRLASGLGDRIPLETERGYNTTLPAGAFDVKRQLVFPEHGFVITPLATGLRVGGAVELAGLDRPPNYARARAMLEKASRFLPGLDTGGGRQWMGYRPSLPDTLPVVGTARQCERVAYAFGNGHLGLTQAAAMGRLARDLVLGHDPAIDLAPFSPRRF